MTKSSFKSNKLHVPEILSKSNEQMSKILKFQKASSREKKNNLYNALKVRSSVSNGRS